MTIFIIIFKYFNLKSIINICHEIEKFIIVDENNILYAKLCHSCFVESDS
jgi:hypothetical protein